MKTVVIALDLGTHLGVYGSGSNGAVTIDLGEGDERFAKFLEVLEEALPPYYLEPMKLVFEEPVIRGKAGKFFNGLIGILKAYCYTYKYPYQGIPVSTVKLLFTGNGRASKEDIMAKCSELKIAYIDHNSADAIAVYHAYLKLKDLNKTNIKVK